MRHTLWALAFLAFLTLSTLTAAAQREGAQSAGGGGGSSGGGSASSSGSSGGGSGGYSGGSSDSGGGSWSGSSSGGSSSSDYGGGGSSSSGASTSRGSSGSSHSSGSASGAAASGSRGNGGNSRGSSVAPVLDDGPPAHPPLAGKHPDKRPVSPPSSPVTPAPGVPASDVGKKAVATPATPVERNARPEAFPHNPCYPHGVQQDGACVPCPSGQFATIANSCSSPPERDLPRDCEMDASNPQCWQRSDTTRPSRSCDWLLRQVEQGESQLAQRDKQRSAACGQDASGAECQALSAQYQQLVQKVRQDQAAYNRCQAGFP